MKLRPLSIAFSMLVSVWTAGVSAQEGIYGESVEVQLVVVDVFVTDRGGEPVLDLGRDDFRVFEDGRPVEIRQFSVASTSPRAASGTAGEEVEILPARLVVFIDNLHIGPNSRRRVFEQLWDVLKRGLAPQDEVMVASYDGNVSVLLPMTADRRALRTVLQDEGRLVAGALVASLGDERVLQLIESRHVEMMDGANPDPCIDLGFIARTHAEQVYGGVQQAISELGRFVNSLAGYGGRKALLHVSDGIPLVAGLEAYRFAIELCDGTGAAKGIPNAIDTSLLGPGKYTRWDPTTAWAELTQFNSAREWSRLAAEANTYQVSIYAVQASGAGTIRRSNVDRARTSFETEADAYRNDQDVLFLLADETGGRAVLDVNDFESALTGMVEDLHRGYQLAYSPPTPGDGKNHSIRVEVERPGVDIRHRRSYQSKGTHERVADGVLATLYHGRQENPLGARLEMVASETVSKKIVNFKVRLRIPLKSLVLLPEGEKEKGLFTVYVAARDGRGFLMPVGQRTIPLSVERADLAQHPDREYIYEVEIPIRGRDNEVAVAIRDEVGGDASYLSRRVQLEGS